MSISVFLQSSYYRVGPSTQPTDARFRLFRFFRFLFPWAMRFLKMLLIFKFIDVFQATMTMKPAVGLMREHVILMPSFIHRPLPAFIASVNRGCCHVHPPYVGSDIIDSFAFEIAKLTRMFLFGPMKTLFMNS